jgi:Ca-activated chloride channel family protein
MKRKTIALATMMILTLITLSVAVPSVAAVYPYMTVDKSVSPTEIYLKGDGGMPDTATVILSIAGAGDPIPGEETYAPTDVVFVVDDTGSMGDDITQVKSDITYITDTLVAEIPDIRFGLVSYKDSAERDLALTSSVSTFKSKVNALYASGGGDWREAVKPALVLSYASSWRSGNVAKVVVLIGDAPPHDEAGANAAAAAAYVDDYGIYTNAIACASGATSSFQNIATAGHGTYAFKADPAGLADAIIDSIKTVVPSIDTAGEDVIVTEVVPSCIEASGFSPTPTTSAGSTHTWDFGKVGIGETKTITFNVKCTEAGDNKLVDVYPATALSYKAWDGTGFNTPTTKPFPETYIDCKVSNKPPVANAGPDKVVEQDSLGGASVTLDGSGSTDDGRILPLTYTWTWAGGSATGVSPTVTLPMGATTVTLTVYDGQYSDTDTVETDICDADPTITSDELAIYPLGATVVTFTATDDTGNSASCTTTVTVEDTTPPEITCPADVTVEQATAAGTVVPLTATATDICDASPTITSDELAIYPLGTTTVTFTATDNAGNSATCTTTVTVIDTTPPVITASGEQIVLWPPNHKYRTVEISDCVISVTDICDADVDIDDIVITSVSSDEPEDAQGKGDGTTVDDIVIVDSLTVELRAERQGGGNGRVYTINFGVTDASGNTETGSCTVWVLHDQEPGSTAIDDGVSAGYRVNYP